MCMHACVCVCMRVIYMCEVCVGNEGRGKMLCVQSVREEDVTSLMSETKKRDNAVGALREGVNDRYKARGGSHQIEKQVAAHTRFEVGGCQ